MKGLRTVPIVLIITTCIQQGSPEPEPGSVPSGEGMVLVAAQKFKEQTMAVIGVDLLVGLEIPIYSINSRMFPVDVETNQMLYPDFDVRFMDEVGHFVQLEDPGTFNQQLRDIPKEII